MSKTLFTAEAILQGGRSGTIQTPDRLLNKTCLYSKALRGDASVTLVAD